jgi:hypothetical protein
MDPIPNSPSTSSGRPKRRTVFRLALVLLGLVGVGYLGLRWYLSSRAAAQRIETRLAAVLGTVVRIDQIAIGWTDGTWLGSVAVHEADDPGTGAAWLNIRDTRADVAAVDWFGGDRPRQIDLEGATIDLRFDANGKLLTQLPWPRGDGSRPRLAVADSQINLRQQERSVPLSLAGLQAEIVWTAPKFVLSGSVCDPRRGDWTLAGFLQPDTREVFLRLQTERTKVDRDNLEQMPFVSPGVWRQVRIDEGVTSVDFTLGFHLDRPGVSYRLELGVSDARLEVVSIDLKADRAAGKVIVKDGNVELIGVKGETAGGHILTSGTLGFRSDGSRMKFDIEVQQADLHRLPKSWHLPKSWRVPNSWQVLPPGIAARLTGQAQLIVATGNGKAGTTGEGNGKVAIDVPRLLEGRLPRSIPIRMTADAEGFHFALDLPPILPGQKPNNLPGTKQ